MPQPRPLPLAATLAALLALAPAPGRALELDRPAPDPRDVESALAPATAPYTPVSSFYVASKAHLATTFRLLQTTLHPGHAAPAAHADDPRPAFLSERQLRRVLARLTPTVVRCLHAVGRKDATVTLRLRMEGATGRVSRAAVIGAFARSPVHRCVTTVARRLRFPRFRQPSQWIVYPVIVRLRSARRTAPAPGRTPVRGAPCP